LIAFVTMIPTRKRCFWFLQREYFW